METKELVEKARALLAAATPGPWGMGNCLGEPRQLETRLTPLAIFGQCVNADLAMFAVNNLPALLDALAAENRRADAAESDAAALPAMDAECARLRAQVDADRQTIVRLTDDRDVARAEVERQKARTAKVCEMCRTVPGEWTIAQHACPACKGSGAVIVEAP